MGSEGSNNARNMPAFNILIESLPTSLEIDGQTYRIDADFRTSLRTILAFEDQSLATVEKQRILIENLFYEVPDNTEAAFTAAMRFINGGGEAEGEQEEKANWRVYSFQQDAPYIFSAFRLTHGIDLQEIEFLHWHKFLYLFTDLGEDTFFLRLVNLRKRLKDGTATKEERTAARSMSAIVQLPEEVHMTPEEMASADRFMDLLRASENGN